MLYNGLKYINKKIQILIKIISTQKNIKKIHQKINKNKKKIKIKIKKIKIKKKKENYMHS
jgi:hypothetical protein